MKLSFEWVVLLKLIDNNGLGLKTYEEFSVANKLGYEFSHYVNNYFPLYKRKNNFGK